ALEQRPREELFARHDTLPAISAGGDEALSTRARLEFLQSIATSGDPDRAARVVDQLLELPAPGLELSSQFVIAFLHPQCPARAPQRVAERSDKVVRQLASFWPDAATDGLRVSPLGNSLELRRRLGLLLAALGDPAVVDRVAKTVLPGPAQEDRLLGLLALRHTRHGWSKDTRREYFTALRDARQFVGGEGLPAFLDRLRTDSLATLDDAER